MKNKYIFLYLSGPLNIPTPVCVCVRLCGAIIYFHVCAPVGARDLCWVSVSLCDYPLVFWFRVPQ